MLNKEYIKLLLELMNKDIVCFDFGNKLIIRMFEGKKIKFVTIEFDNNDNFIGYKVDYVDDKEHLERQIKCKRQAIDNNNRRIYNGTQFKEIYLKTKRPKKYYKDYIEDYDEAIIRLNKENEQLEQEIVQLQERIKQSENEMTRIIKNNS